MDLSHWAQAWGISPAAMMDLRARLGHEGVQVTMHPKRPDEGASESRVQSLVRLEASQKDVLMFRNNSGALKDERGVPVRYGLANESAQQNKVLKSSDLIGIRKRLITVHDVGSVIGQFVARECKHGTWVYDPRDDRERAQNTFLELVLSYGGDAAFASGVGTL